jgi:hypothetical protein
MVGHPGIDKIQFVGSGATAKKVLRHAAETLKPCGLELGGKSAVIVFADADLKEAARRGLSGAVSVSGQGCVNGTRLLVERPVYDWYLQMLQACGAHPGGDPSILTAGPIISEASYSAFGTIDTAEPRRRPVTGARLGDAAGFYLPLTTSPMSTTAVRRAARCWSGCGHALDTEDEAIARQRDSYGSAPTCTRTTCAVRMIRRVASRPAIQVNGSAGMAPNVSAAARAATGGRRRSCLHSSAPQQCG